MFELAPKSNRAAVGILKDHFENRKDRLPTAIYKHVKGGKQTDFPEVRFSFAKKFRQEKQVQE